MVSVPIYSNLFYDVMGVTLHRDILQYDDVTVPLALTDCDVLNNKSPPQSVEGMKVAAVHETIRECSWFHNTHTGGQCKAIRMQFSLPPACYATMAVRELTKMETSSHYQTQFNSLSSQQSTSKQTLQ